jgi:hypothetical protein
VVVGGFDGTLAEVVDGGGVEDVVDGGGVVETVDAGGVEDTVDGGVVLEGEVEPMREVGVSPPDGIVDEPGPVATVEPGVVEPEVVEPDAVEPEAVEPEVVELDGAAVEVEVPLDDPEPLQPAAAKIARSPVANRAFTAVSLPCATLSSRSVSSRFVHVFVRPIQGTCVRITTLSRNPFKRKESATVRGPSLYCQSSSAVGKGSRQKS